MGKTVVPDRAFSAGCVAATSNPAALAIIVTEGGGGFKKKNSVFLLLVSSYLPLHGLWVYGRLSAWLIAHSNPVPTPRPLRGRLINSDSLLRVLLLDSKFFYKNRSSSAAPPRLRCLLQLANKKTTDLYTRRHVVFASGRAGPIKTSRSASRKFSRFSNWSTTVICW